MYLLVVKIYGRTGHRQKETFNDSKQFDFSTKNMTRFLLVLNSDITGTNDYTMMIIVTNSEKECYNELWGQISNGIFENYGVGQVDIINCFEMGGKI